MWKPQVTPLAEYRPTPEGPVATKTSLAANKQPFNPVTPKYNAKAAPFSPGGSGKKMVNSQYNTPMNIYSDDAIAEALSSQAEVLGQGVIGVNFMKNDKAFESHKSDVLKMVQEMDIDPPRVESPGIKCASPAAFGPSESPVQGQSFKLLERMLHDGTEIPSEIPSLSGGPGLKPGENICSICGSLIAGVFVRIKNKNLHAECFKCATCGISLRNQGYYQVNDKPYCDTHAKAAAKKNPPGPSYEPITVGPGSPLPSGALTTAQAATKKPVAPASPKIQPPSATSGLYKPPAGGVKIMPSIPTPTPYKPVAFSAPTAPSPAVNSPTKHVSAPFSRPAGTQQTFGGQSGDINVRAHIPKKAPTGPAPSFLSEGFKISSAPAPAAPSPLFDMPKPTPPPSGLGSGPPQRGVAQLPGRKAPRRGRGIMNPANASRVPHCAVLTCQRQIRGPFVSALGKTWCPDCFACATTSCKKQLINVGFVEEKGGLHCEDCFERFLAPSCPKCDRKIKGDCLNAVSQSFHPECFCCAYCGCALGSGPFYLEDGLPYCEFHWNELFTTKCISCDFPIEAGDRWVEALNNNYHSQCFKCSKCHKSLEGQSFIAKGGKPFCKKQNCQRGI